MRYQRDGFSVRAGMVKGREPPQWYVDEPPVIPGLTDAMLLAFRRLSSERAWGFGGAGQIPWTRLVAYADWLGLDADAGRHFVAIIEALDDAWLADTQRK